MQLYIAVYIFVKNERICENLFFWTMLANR